MSGCEGLVTVCSHCPQVFFTEFKDMIVSAEILDVCPECDSICEVFSDIKKNKGDYEEQYP